MSSSEKLRFIVFVSFIIALIAFAALYRPVDAMVHSRP